MENKKEQVTINDLINDMKKIRESLDRSNEFRKELVDILKEKIKKQKIPDEIVIHYDFQMW